MRSKVSTRKRNFNRITKKAIVKGLLALGTCFLAPLWAFAYGIDNDREVSPQKPVNISASQMTVDRVKGLTYFKKMVKATHNHVVLTADEITSLSNNYEATAEGHVHVVDPTAAMTLTCGNLEYLDLMNTMTAHDQPMLTSVDDQGKPVTVTGRQMELDSVKKTIVVNQNVKIDSKDGRSESNKATLLADENKMILEDDPKMFVTNGQLSGRRITSYLKGERRVIVEGMAEAIFSPSGKPVTVSKDKKNTNPGPKGSGTSPTSPLNQGNSANGSTPGASSGTLSTSPGGGPFGGPGK